ncbi:MAG: hypothetical protein KDA78_09900 [Planctomycetaceae bacterium]|nr:hypothetical protein [Planctomycetaceae bacterium]
MRGAIFYSSSYGSTAQYANWISEATGLPVFDAYASAGDPSEYDFLVLGSSVILMRMTLRKWVRANWNTIQQKPVYLFSVTGAAPDDPLIQKWLHASYPDELIARAPHHVLGGRLDLSQFNWFMRVFMFIGAYTKPTKEKRRDMLEGFDRIDRDGIAPVVEWARQIAME